MKKALVAVGLLALVIYGIYDVAQKKQAVDEIESKQNAEKQQTEGSGITVEEKQGSAVREQAGEPEEKEPVVGLLKGNIAPDFTLNAFSGDEPLTLSSLRGKKVMLNMWASWCPPCRAEMPDMQAFYEDSKDTAIQVLGVNLTAAEHDPEDVAVFADKYALTFPIALDEQNLVAELYQIRSIPTTFILNEEGIIVQKITGPMTYEMMENVME